MIKWFYKTFHTPVGNEMLFVELILLLKKPNELKTGFAALDGQEYKDLIFKI